mmetsp:Transcript_17840/g.38384  ORF Transcript_17840/g.38384 Transcript_17840/m.38384 type:complete len:219 (-) Transcript_17840:735-1391(-)
MRIVNATSDVMHLLCVALTLHCNCLYKTPPCFHVIPVHGFANQLPLQCNSSTISSASWLEGGASNYWQDPLDASWGLGERHGRHTNAEACEELQQVLRGLICLILMDGVARHGHQHQLELALHLPDGQRLVQPVGSSEEQHLRAGHCQEGITQPLVPALPEGPALLQGGSPHVVPAACILPQLGGHRHSRCLLAPAHACACTPADCLLQRREVRRSAG